MKREEMINKLVDRLLSIERRHPVRVAIDGVDAAGKTMLADELAPALRSKNHTVIRASIDGFHNAGTIRHARGELSPEGYYRDSFNYEALNEWLLIPLGPGGTRGYKRRVFDYRTDALLRDDTETATEDSILLFDGVFLLRNELANRWDFSIFVDASFNITLERALTRDQPLFGSPEQVRERYEKRYIPGQQMYLAECEPRKRANAVVLNNDVENPEVLFRCDFED